MLCFRLENETFQFQHLSLKPFLFPLLSFFQETRHPSASGHGGGDDTEYYSQRARDPHQVPGQVRRVHARGCVSADKMIRFHNYQRCFLAEQVTGVQRARSEQLTVRVHLVSVTGMLCNEGQSPAVCYHTCSYIMLLRCIQGLLKAECVTSGLCNVIL